MLQYLHGAGQEIYYIPKFPECMVGHTFAEAAAFIFDECDAILLALDSTGHRQQLIIAPYNQVGVRNIGMSGHFVDSCLCYGSCTQNSRQQKWFYLCEEFLVELSGFRTDLVLLAF